MAPWIEDVLNWVQSLGARVAKLLSPAADAIKDAIEASADKIEGDALEFIQEAALDSIKAANGIAGSGVEKLEYAVTYFLNILATKGIVWGISEAKTLIQNVYMGWRATLPAVAPFPPVEIPGITDATA